MFSYVPKDALLKGLKLGEFKYKDLEDEVRSDKSFIEAALKVSPLNIKYIPTGCIAKDDAMPVSAFNRALSDGETNEMLEILRIFSGKNLDFDKFIASKAIFVDILKTIFQEGANPKFVFPYLTDSHPIFTDNGYIRKVFNDLEKEPDINFNKISAFFIDFCINNVGNEVVQKLNGDVFFAKYKIGDNFASFPFSEFNSPEKFLEFLDYAYAIRDELFQEKLKFAIINMYFNKMPKNIVRTPEVLAKLLVVTSYKKEIEFYSISTFYNNRLNFYEVVSVMLEVIKSGFIITYLDSGMADKILTTEHASVIFSSSTGFMGDYIYNDYDLFDAKGNWIASKKDKKTIKAVFEALDFSQMQSAVWKEIYDVISKEKGLKLISEFNHSKENKTKDGVKNMVDKIIAVLK